ncbi:uncharacterized protein FA14DRAFT_156968 [Meira miltonrushii]|uniref:DUF866-domain-containing protein n=1 Tax=Meira miltonrushii TaxID=1280837 RepID=A0A316VA14_9BASI|nr:uncharacterized protein FA14DRAFT_156968 [Meira miltonrushii]PWN34302.1 hypothetical protein FA14DRAFT_156968 [Meira miltonrushii]
MPRLALQIRAQLENVTDLRPADDNYTIMAKLKCTSCQEEHAKLVGFSKDDEVEMSKGRSTSNLVMHCQSLTHTPLPLSGMKQFCKKEISAKFEEPTAKAPLWRPYAPSAGATFETIAIVEARGLDFLSIDFSGTWKCRSTESDTKFDDVEFEEGEWTDYDEKGGVSVSIMEIESQWVRA